MKVAPILSIAAALFAAGIAAAQPRSNSTTTTHKTPVGSVTHTQTTAPMGNGTRTTHTVTPGNGSRPAPYVGATVTDQAPNREQSTVAPTAGVVIPY